MSAVCEFKFVTVGDSGVGKTSILRYLTEGQPALRTESTLGIEFFIHFVTIGGRLTRLVIYDTAGQERYASIVRTYLRDALGVLLVFDIADRAGFESLPPRLRAIREETAAESSVVLIGNKADLGAGRRVARSEAEAFASQHGLRYIETSARDGTNIQEAFLQVATELCEKVADGRIVVAPKQGLVAKKSGCC
jgi:small GTP-binding protein